MRPYRSKSKLVLELLKVVRDEGNAQTNRVLLRANLSYARLQSQIEGSVTKGWIEESSGSTPRSWRLTPEEARVLRALEEVEDLVGDFGLPL
ncbi:MAG: winged helix-turn-helix domain-containing protein [Thermoplasmatota archaeon]